MGLIALPARADEPLLWVVDADRRQLACYRRDGDAVRLVGARRVVVDLKLTAIADRSPHLPRRRWRPVRGPAPVRRFLEVDRDPPVIRTAGLRLVAARPDGASGWALADGTLTSRVPDGWTLRRRVEADLRLEARHDRSRLAVAHLAREWARMEHKAGVRSAPRHATAGWRIARPAPWLGVGASRRATAWLLDPVGQLACYTARDDGIRFVGARRTFYDRRLLCLADVSARAQRHDVRRRAWQQAGSPRLPASTRYALHARGAALYVLTSRLRRPLRYRFTHAGIACEGPGAPVEGGGLPLDGAPESLTAAVRVGEQDVLWVLHPDWGLCAYAYDGRAIALVGVRRIEVDLGLEYLREQE